MRKRRWIGNKDGFRAYKREKGLEEGSEGNVMHRNGIKIERKKKI